MRIKIVCVGRLKERYWTEAVREYEKRLRPYCELTIDEVKESPADDIDEEGVNILKRIGDHDHVITLEIKGNALTSEELSAKLDDLALGGTSDVTFVIGGSNGLSDEVSARAAYKLSFSKMTFPHQLMRVILLEQVYRSFKISKHEPYHK
ncbi:MAG: 23S rRNA (pseudouridine(1915)-N(3))-methyltransferase RlmH [Eubacteriaceae bacterium]|nr:23S rRNA (pseudouridine(1915)-N(3))-methyltransferase RlmH [Eubacteriaceae bacterium]